MLDTNGRQKIQPFFDGIAKWLIKVNMSANQVTLLALVIGLVPSFLLFGTDLIVLPVAILWVSGIFDAVDGTVARLSQKSSYFGTIMDITFDRVVEIGLIIGLAYRHETYAYGFLVLACSIILSMTIFLTVAAASEKSSFKSFYYQPGLAERTEGFIMFSLMILFETYILYILIVFIVMILITAIQRFREAYKYFGKS